MIRIYKFAILLPHLRKVYSDIRWLKKAVLLKLMNAQISVLHIENKEQMFYNNIY